MKLNKIIILLCVTILFYSCSKDRKEKQDENLSVSKSKIDSINQSEKGSYTLSESTADTSLKSKYIFDTYTDSTIKKNINIVKNHKFKLLNDTINFGISITQIKSLFPDYKEITDYYDSLKIAAILLEGKNPRTQFLKFFFLDSILIGIILDTKCCMDHDSEEDIGGMLLDSVKKGTADLDTNLFYIKEDIHGNDGFHDIFTYVIFIKNVIKLLKEKIPRVLHDFEVPSNEEFKNNKLEADGKFIGIYVGDYFHYTFALSNGDTSGFFLEPSSDFEHYIIENVDKKFRLRYEKRWTYIWQAGGYEIYEWLVDAKTDSDNYNLWRIKFYQNPKRNELIQHYDELIEKYSIYF
jgi:hypothetical protein